MSFRHAFFHRQPKIPVSRKTGIHAAAPARCFFQQFSFAQPHYNRLNSIYFVVFQPFIRLNISYLWLNLLYHSVVLFSISIHACNTIISKCAFLSKPSHLIGITAHRLLHSETQRHIFRLKTHLQ